MLSRPYEYTGWLNFPFLTKIFGISPNDTEIAVGKLLLELTAELDVYSISLKEAFDQEYILITYKNGTSWTRLKKRIEYPIACYDIETFKDFLKIEIMETFKANKGE